MKNQPHIFRTTLILATTTAILATDFSAVASNPLLSTRTHSAVLASSADREWKTLQHDYATPPPPLKQLPNRMYTDKEIHDYYSSVANRAGGVADEAKQFYTRYPKSSDAAKARDMYFEMLHTAVGYGSRKRVSELEAATAERLKTPKLDDAARFQLSMRLLRSTVSGRQYESDDAMRAELEKRALQLAREYPNHPDGYRYLMNLARVAPPAKSTALAREVLATCKDEKTRTECRGLITRSAAVGKPFELTLATTDGKTLDLRQMRGKPVLLLFWDSTSQFSSKAIWVIENKIYKTYHAKGLEVIGLNFDADPSKAASTIKDYDLKWPQYLDRKSGWKLRDRFGVETLPLCWFVDKKGILRDIHGERDPIDVAEKLLAE